MAAALKFRHQFAVMPDPELLVENLLLADRQAGLGFGSAVHAAKTPATSEGSQPFLGLAREGH
jgi:hypothetical protein